MLEIPALGPRGEGWVALQLVASAAVAACGFVGVAWPGGVEPYLVVAGLLALAAGVVLTSLGMAALGRSLSPFPRPRAGAELRRHGVYRHARHPIYGGVLLVALGWSLAVAPLGLAPAALLVALFELKSRREEAWLAERWPAYADYRERTRARFLPFLW